MIVLHALWNPTASGSFHLWAESADLFTVTSKRARKVARGEKAQRHPFALSEAALQEVIDNLTETLLIKGMHDGMLTVRLPSMSTGPQPSPELVLTQMRDSKQEMQLGWWDILTLQCDASHALDFLLRLPDRPARKTAFGASLCFWALVAQFAFEVISRQCFVPSLREEERRGQLRVYRAAWEALLSPEDSERLQVLATAMPPLCWSFTPPGEQKASLPQEIVKHFINCTIDAFVRESLSTTALLSTPLRNGRSLPLPERWLRALSSTDATVTASPSEGEQFTSLLRNWLQRLRPVSLDASFRTCFKLDAPDEEREDPHCWQISFHLQASDDRSLLIPAERVWQERSSTLTFLKRKFENPQERLLADLGKAASLFPALEACLHTACPQAVALNTEEAYHFLREIAPLLEESGFGVLIPPWWQKPAARIGVKLKVWPKMVGQTGSGLMGLQSIVDYNWNVAIGDTTLTAQEFAHLVSLKQPLVNVRGQWVELRPQEIEAAIAFFQKRQAKKGITLGEALRISQSQEQSEIGLPVLDMEADGWVKDVLERLSQPAQLAPVEVPPTFCGKLRPYQERGVSWLAFLKRFGFGGCLADDMGLGKSIELIGLLLYMKQRRESTAPAQPTLLICPMSIVGNWQREFQRFAPSLSVLIHHGLERLSGPEFTREASQHDVVITTYALALRDKEHLASIEWENIVIDEAQNIKNETAKQTQAIKSLHGRHKIALTGTPVENRLSELWSIMEFLNPGYLGSGTDFRKQFALPIERYHNPERAAALKRLIQPFVLRRLKTDKEIIQDLPDKLEMKVFCNLTQEQASLYEAVVKEMLEKIEQAVGMERRGLVLSTLMKLKQICNHPAHFMSDKSNLTQRSGKLARLEAMLEEVLATGEKALIFTQFAEMGTLLRQYLQETFGVETLFLHGATPKKQRDSMVQRFQEDRHTSPFFILSIKAGGVGLNLTGANHVFHFDRWWNPAVENQATDRAFRIGQQKNVQVHKFVCVGTLEERIDQMIEQKKELAERIVSSGEQWLTEMSTTQLKELFTLSREAVGE